MSRIERLSMWMLIFLLFLIGIVPFNYRPDFVWNVFGYAMPVHHLIYFCFGFWCLFHTLWIVKSGVRLPVFMILNVILFLMMLMSSIGTQIGKFESLQSSFGILLRGMGPGFLSYWLVFKNKKEEKLSKLILFFGVVIGIIAIYEVLSGKFFILSRFNSDIDPSSNFATGAIGQPLPLSILLNLIFPLALEPALTKKGFLANMAMVVLVVALVMTYRRSGYLIMGLSMFLFIIFRRPSIKVVCLVLVGILLCAATIWTLKPVRERFIQRWDFADKMNQIQIGHRIKACSVAWRMACDAPTLGVGTRQYKYFYKKYANYEGAADTPDSQYLRFLSENGFVGVIIFIGFLGTILWRLFIGRKKIYAVGFLLSIFSLSLGLIINESLYWPPIQYLAWIIMGMGVGLADRQQSDQNSHVKFV